MFEAKTVMITGGSSGLGKELALRFLERGANVALFARDQEKLRSVRDELEKNTSGSQQVKGFPCDVSQPQSVEKAFLSATEGLDPPDILVNSAGVLREGPFMDQTLEVFREVMDINFFGTLNCIKSILPIFERKGEGRIVNICSMAGFMGVFGYSAYCSSKHALVGLSSVLRMEMKPKNINVHLVCPPEFESPMVDELNDYRTVLPENRIPVISGHERRDPPVILKKAVMRGEGVFLVSRACRSESITCCVRSLAGCA